ncbi:MAG: acyl-CoA dehydrogenase family protein [Thermoprotei archaeon]
MADSIYGLISNAYGKNHFEVDYPFRALLEYFGYDGGQLSELGGFVGGVAYEVADYVDKVARPRLVYWSIGGERVDKAWLDPALRLVLNELVKRFRVNERPYTVGDWFHYFSAIYLIGDPGVSCILTVTNQTAYAIHKYGDSGAKRFLPGLIGEGEPLFGATWFTEVQGGSDLGANLVEAYLDGGVWRLRGIKYFSSNAGLAGVALVTARPRGARSGVKGVSLFLVPEFDSRGKRNFNVLRLKEKSGTLSVPTGEVEFDGSEAILLGDADKGIYYTMEDLMVSRLSNAVGALGIARKAYLEAYYYSQRREAFGRRLLDHPLVQRDLVEMEVFIEGAMSVAFRAIDAFQKSWRQTPPYGEEYHYARLLTHIAKNLTAEAAAHVTRLAMELHGGIGFLSEFPVERWHREALITPIWEGPSNIQALDMLEAIAKKGAHIVLLRELEERMGDFGGCDAEHSALYKEMHSRINGVFREMASLGEREAQFAAKDVLMEIGHSLAVATLAHASCKLGSRRLLSVAETYKERFVDKRAITPRGPEEMMDIISVDKSF